jgi:hypothetical protein
MSEQESVSVEDSINTLILSHQELENLIPLIWNLPDTLLNTLLKRLLITSLQGKK